MKNIVIIGAGPAGLTAALHLLQLGECKVTLLEKNFYVGGISRTVNHNGNLIDIGGHRFFSKSQEVNELWEKLLPVKEDASKYDNCMLVRPRVSHIYYGNKFFDYPITLSTKTIRNLGLRESVNCAFGYLSSCFNKRDEISLEDFYINRFGEPLYDMFFKTYTEKVWGISPAKLSPDWGRQRVKGLSIATVIKNAISKTHREKETSLIEKFLYPKYGSGQMWETIAEGVLSLGGNIKNGARVNGINFADNKVSSVEFKGKTDIETLPCDALVSSMPLSELVESFHRNVPEEIEKIAKKLPYRDFIAVGLLIDRKDVVGELKDNWIYMHDPNIKFCRIQIFNNWSPYLVSDFDNTVWIGLEYCCNETDLIWNVAEPEFLENALSELLKTGVVREKTELLDGCVIHQEKAYPVYTGSYYELDKLRSWLDEIDNLYCIGRNGQHRYNNMDHSMLTGMRAAECILDLGTNRNEIWNVNTEQRYHESK